MRLLHRFLMLQSYVICFRKRQCSAVSVVRRSVIGRPDVSTNGKLNGCWQMDLVNNDTRCPKSNYYEEINIKHQDEPLDHRCLLFHACFEMYSLFLIWCILLLYWLEFSNRWRRRPQKYLEKGFCGYCFWYWCRLQQWWWHSRRSSIWWGISEKSKAAKGVKLARGGWGVPLEGRWDRGGTFLEH